MSLELLSKPHLDEKQDHGGCMRLADQTTT
jgi:hypothetical protein